MKIITYKFADGTESVVEVSDELYAIHEEIVAEEKRNHWKNTRRHTSLSYLNEHEIDIEAQDSDPSVELIKQLDAEKLHKAMDFLSDKQRELVEKVFFERKSMTEIAEIEGIDRTAISHRFATIYKKLKKLL